MLVSVCVLPEESVADGDDDEKTIYLPQTTTCKSGHTQNHTAHFETEVGVTHA